MPFFRCIAIVLVLVRSGTAFADEAAKLPFPIKVPDGFTIELVAASPLVERPIVAAFDDDGHLYVAESSGSNDKVEKQLEDKPHRIVRLDDTDGDGRFDKRTVFADQMMFPEGTLFFDGSLYVSAPPSIWKLTDKDGDGVADERVDLGERLTGAEERDEPSMRLDDALGGGGEPPGRRFVIRRQTPCAPRRPSRRSSSTASSRRSCAR